MKAIGIIAEFNPLHNGHIEHINKTKEINNNIICIMSGNFVQRGEPAIIDKWKRTYMALTAGIDIVIEMPVSYVISGADYFARAGINILSKTGIVDSICFGSESGDINDIKHIGDFLANETDEYKKALHNALNLGLSFPKAREQALESCINISDKGLFYEPNNCLAIEYCKAIFNTNIKPYTTHRISGGPSATSIRKNFIKEKNSMPDYVYNILIDNKFLSIDDFNKIFKYAALTTGIESSEGLENRFMQNLRKYDKIHDIIKAVKTKRYTYTRLQRIIIKTILNIKNKKMTAYENLDGPRYIRVLGFRRQSANILSELVKHAKLPVITHNKTINQLHGTALEMLKDEYLASDIYNLVLGEFSNEQMVIV